MPENEMRVMWCETPNQVEVRRIPIYEPADDEVLVKVAYAPGMSEHFWVFLHPWLSRASSVTRSPGRWLPLARTLRILWLGSMFARI